MLISSLLARCMRGVFVTMAAEWHGIRYTEIRCAAGCAYAPS